MKVTAIIDDNLVNEVKNFSRSKTVTEAITVALKDWLDIYHLKELNEEVIKKPLKLDSAKKLREVNRNR